MYQIGLSFYGDPLVYAVSIKLITLSGKRTRRIPNALSSNLMSSFPPALSASSLLWKRPAYHIGFNGKVSILKSNSGLVPRS